MMAKLFLNVGYQEIDVLFYVVLKISRFRIEKCRIVPLGRDLQHHLLHLPDYFRADQKLKCIKDIL